MAEEILVERLPVRRRGRGPHPTGEEALRARVLGERGRIASASAFSCPGCLNMSRTTKQHITEQDVIPMRK